MKESFLSRHATVCDECDWVSPIPIMEDDQRLLCPRCDHVLLFVPKQRLNGILAYGGSAILMLVLSLSFPFLSFSVAGVTRTVTLWQDISILLQQSFPLLGLLILLALLVIPFVYLSAAVWLAWRFKRERYNQTSRYLIRVLMGTEPWLMVDVFLVGVIVALIKMQGEAAISVGMSFWALCLGVICLLKTASKVDTRWCWTQVSCANSELNVSSGVAWEQGLKGCDGCGAVLLNQTSHCQRCGHKAVEDKPKSVKVTIALLLASIIMYVPANLFAIMETTYFGVSTPSTIVGGVLMLWEAGSYPIAVIILIASVFIPIAKVLALGWLCWQSYRPSAHQVKNKVTLYRLTDFVGRWSMIDVFVVATLTGLVQLGGLVRVLPGNAVLCFAAVVILTMLAAKSFDSRLLWDKANKK